MDFNLVVLAGRVTAPAELRSAHQVAEQSESAYVAGDSFRAVRLLLTVRSKEPHPRVDLLPVAARLDQIPAALEPGEEIWVTGSLQRLFNTASGRSRLEVVAHHISRNPVTG